MNGKKSSSKPGTLLTVPRSPGTILPVWGMRRCLSSTALDTADTLVDNLDNLAEILDHLVDKHNTEPGTVNGENNINHSVASGGQSGESLFRKLKTTLDATRSLIGCLRKEKDTLMKRQLSVECRLGEIEDYRTHMKQDMTSMNETVELLGSRVCQLEDQLVEEQELREVLEVEKADMEDSLQQAEKFCLDLSIETDRLLAENARLRKERTNTSLKLEVQEMKYEVEMLLDENRTLKEMVRDRSDGMGLAPEGDLCTILLDNSNNNNNNRCGSGVSNSSHGNISSSKKDHSNSNTNIHNGNNISSPSEMYSSSIGDYKNDSYGSEEPSQKDLDNTDVENGSDTRRNGDNNRVDSCGNSSNSSSSNSIAGKSDSTGDESGIEH